VSLENSEEEVLGDVRFFGGAKVRSDAVLLVVIAVGEAKHSEQRPRITRGPRMRFVAEGTWY